MGIRFILFALLAISMLSPAFGMRKVEENPETDPQKTVIASNLYEADANSNPTNPQQKQSNSDNKETQFKSGETAIQLLQNFTPSNDELSVVFSLLDLQMLVKMRPISSRFRGIADKELLKHDADSKNSLMAQPFVEKYFKNETNIRPSILPALRDLALSGNINKAASGFSEKLNGTKIGAIYLRNRPAAKVEILVKM